ncbi:hypothetical protein UFOVP39_42 [uncultured Caudovirales phage]|uniref:Uncharacterized protein n=1 Tax=uncultured Caudovirales phage TaxID=2100421 RepID=A0A6J5T952_9CAUD|nr:hypothetical protein UFOVP39_42 [uncultured Caudovirales phage]
MFSIKWKENTNYDSNKVGLIFNKDNVKVCEIETWGFNSCACFILKAFAYQGEKLIDTDEFWKFVTSKDHDLNWYPDEVYLLLSTEQLPKWRKLYKRKDVRLRDRFTNKAHGPCDLFLFRYSKAGDWKRRSYK